MAVTDRQSSAALKTDLIRNGHAFSFFQVMRILKFFSQDTGTGPIERSGGPANIRIRPELSLAFPPSDVAKIEETVDDGREMFRVDATFLGLYGSSSPLPVFYTTDLMEEAAEDRTVSRDFIDIFNHRLYYFLYRSWTKYRQFLQVVEEKSLKDIERLFCLIGLGEKLFRDDMDYSYSLLRYAGLLTQFPRSASGLETLLVDALDRIPVEVVPCISRKVKIPPDQRMNLGASGSSLGQDSVVGEEIDDRMGKFRLTAGPLHIDQFHELLPGSPGHRKLVFLTRFYLTDQLEYDIKLVLAEAEVRTACLGGRQWSRLGLNTWSFSGDHQGEVNAVFPPHYA
jgi:type VI secretion system protein ImpH